MTKFNIVNFVIYDLSTRFHLVESHDIDHDIVSFIANSWNRKHFVSGFSKDTRQKFII